MVMTGFRWGVDPVSTLLEILQRNQAGVGRASDDQGVSTLLEILLIAYAVHHPDAHIDHVSTLLEILPGFT